MDCINCKSDNLIIDKIDNVYPVMYCGECFHIKQYECPHINNTVIKFKTSNDKVQVKRLCKDCKKMYGSALPHASYDLGKLYLMNKADYDKFHTEINKKYLEYREGL